MSSLPRTVDLSLGLDEPDTDAHLRRRVAREIGVAQEELPPLVVRKRSLDARRGRVRFQLHVELLSESESARDRRRPREVRGERVVIVGDGPAGLFAAYELACSGIACTIIERGKHVQPRRRDLKGLNRHGTVHPDSNYCFGEGGAGTYSDGKLYTRAHKRGDIRDVLEILVDHGAPENILVDARPHIGSNRLPKVVSALRETLEAVGVEFCFERRVTGLLRRPSGDRFVVTGVSCADDSEVSARHVILATGHSARDIFRMLADLGEELEAKPFAVGVRIEHPQLLINRIQYGRHAGHPKLSSAAYRLTHTDERHSVFSFCMCPGGWVVPAATEQDGLVINGMSLSKRNSPYANSGIVTSVSVEEHSAQGYEGSLGGVEFQRVIEQATLGAGGGQLRAPATRVTDFLEGKASSTLPTSSYIPGLTASNVAEVLDAAGLNLAERLRDGLRAFGERLPGYLTEDAVVIAGETRTSCPVRIPRDPQTLWARRHQGLYPCGEGAGYAGGIMSAALDGIRVARRIAASLD